MKNTMTDKQKQQLIDDMLSCCERKENDFPIINQSGNVAHPIIHNGIVRGYRELHCSYKGLAIEVNDHGNVTVWKCFKNGNRREVASRV